MSSTVTETSLDILTPVNETSFDILVKNIATPTRKSRSNITQSQNDATAARAARKSQSLSFAKSRAGSINSSVPENAQDANAQTQYSALGRANIGHKDAHRSARPGTTNWTSRSRSGSVASSSSSDKLSHSGMLRHAVGRTTTIRQEQTRQLAAAKSIGAPSRPGCVLSSDPEMMKNVKGTTPSGLPVWWCRFDNMVVFDGMLKDSETGDWIPMTRSSKGLPISNCKGQDESALLELQCNHCKTLLDLHTWRYSTKVCQRSVCAGCKVRCRQEYFRMMKEGHSFNHFEKVSQDPVTDEAVLARISTPELTRRILEPSIPALIRTSEPPGPIPEAHQDIIPTNTLAELRDATASPPSAQHALDQFQFLQPVARQPGHYELGVTEDVPILCIQPESQVPQTLSSITAIPYDTHARNDQPKLSNSQRTCPDDTLSCHNEHSKPGQALELARDDIGLAITLHCPSISIRDLRLKPQSEVVYSPCHIITDFVLPDLPQEVLQDTLPRNQPDSPQSEHPATPTFAATIMLPVPDDLLSPGLKEDRFEEDEPFDISLYVKNLDTNEVTSLPVGP